MSGRDSFPPYPEARFAFSREKGAAARLHSPRQNYVLAALPAEEYERLLPHLELVPLPLGWTVHRAGDREEYLYFLTAGIVSKFFVAENGESTEFALTGSEGVIGVASFLGGESMPSEAVVLSAGYAYRFRADLLDGEFKHHGQLLHLLLRYTQALIAQTGQIAVCNRHHSVEQQLCRCILTLLDRSPSSKLTMTQELIAATLGVRRSSVTKAAGKLQMAGLIQYSRGHIAVVDRRQLEAQVCECYAVVKREYDRLLPPENTIGDAGGRALTLHDTRRLSGNTSRLSSVMSAAHVPDNIIASTTSTRERFLPGNSQARLK